MARHLLALFGAVTLLQGALLLSPIPVPEQEWEEFSALLRDPAYRLPTTTLPDRYELSLTPYFDTNDAKAFTFDGTVKIYISATEATSLIVMHCNDLTVLSVSVTSSMNQDQQIASSDQDLSCQAPHSFLMIKTTEDLQLGVTYEVNMEFTGRLQTNMRGFYRSWYIDSTENKRWMATTQFQPGHARQAFPCYDEPGFKATFDITINREPDFSPSISNMPIKESSPTSLVPGRIAETFYTTPYTSTYLLAFIVSHYVVVADKDDAQRPFKIYARDNAGSTGSWSLEVGIKLLREMEEYTQIPYYTMAPYLDMKQAAIPDFSAGAMENWGLLTYREALILYDPQNSNHFYKQRVANIVAHEIAHMWFGNLVTCAWWDNLWLNEGFARFYQYFLTAKVADLGFETRFIVEQFEQAMTADSVDSAHALTNPNVNDPTTVSSHFSAITYARGACIIRMTQHLLSEDTFVKGLRSYLKDRQFDVAEPHHLFEALDAAAAEDGALTAYNGITIERYFRTWSEKAGHPLLTVTIDQETGEMRVNQARWERNTGDSQHSGLWDIPITWTRAGAADFDNLKPSQFITEKNTIIQSNSNGREWVVFNKQASGFYRVNYDRTNWALITQALRSNVDVIHEYNRAQIIDDLINFGRAGVMSYERVFNIISFLEFDSQYAPWINAISGFNFLIRRLAHDAANLNKLQSVIINLSKAITARLGYVEREDEPYMDGLLRMYAMQFLCNIKEEQCVNTGKDRFAAWKNGEFVPANMRPWVYCVGLQEGTSADFDYFWNRYLNEDLAGEQVVMLQAAGCTTDQGSLEKFLNAIVETEELVRPQDLTTALNSAVSRNEVNTLRVFEWLKNNIEKTSNKFGSISTPLSYIAPRLLTESDIEKFESWLQDNRAVIGEPAFATGNNGVNTVRNNLEWSAKRTHELEIFFETGYVDDELDDSNEITEEPPVITAETTLVTDGPIVTTDAPVVTTDEPVVTTDEPVVTTDDPVVTTDDPVVTTDAPIETTTPENDDDGAATIALSVVALTVSLAITFLN